MDQREARRALTRGMQLAYSGELGAIRAYLGHRLTVKDPEERNAITRILKDELRHRRRIRRMLAELRSGPDRFSEWKLERVGRAIAAFCFVGGWFLPMYGAARLEAQNVGEYEVLARLAWLAGMEHWVEVLLEQAEVEWDHEQVLRSYASTHWLWRLFPKWQALAPRKHIRQSFEEWTEQPTPPKVRRPWIVR